MSEISYPQNEKNERLLEMKESDGNFYVRNKMENLE